MKHVLKTDYDRFGLAFVIHRDLGGKWNNTLPYLRTRTIFNYRNKTRVQMFYFLSKMYGLLHNAQTTDSVK